MKKYILAALVAVIAVSTATSAYANSERGEGGLRGIGRGWFNFGGHGWGKENKPDKLEKDERDDERGPKPEKQNPLDPCRKDARTILNTAMKGATQTFMEAKKTARLVRTNAIISANGDQVKIDAAWTVYQTSFVTAWTTYSDAVYAAMKTFGTAFAKCKVVVTPTPTPSATPLPSYTLETVATHNVAASCWTVVSGKVYNLTSFIRQHPGGRVAILGMCGVDATTAFNAQHSGQTNPANELAGLQIGTLR